MKIKPLGSNVVVKDTTLNETTKSGIVLPTSSTEKPNLAKVIAVGKGEVVNGKLVALEVNVYDTVLYSKFAGNVFKFEGVEYKILNENDIIAVIEE